MKTQVTAIMKTNAFLRHEREEAPRAPSASPLPLPASPRSASEEARGHGRARP